MEAYARLGLTSMSEALRLVEDYFALGNDVFVGRWLPGRAAALRRQTTSASWRTIVDSLNNQKQLLEIPIIEEYRGNLAAHYTFVKDNRFYTETSTITVPYTNIELDIKFESFRDKLQPGQEEQWKIKITGSKGKKRIL